LKFYKIITLLIILTLFTGTLGNQVRASSLTDFNKKTIDDYVKKVMEEGKVPGVSISVVKGNETLYAKGYGYSDLKNKTEVTTETLFELGSNSKAFTGIALWKLISDGKVDLDDPVTKYLPWFIVKCHGEVEIVKVRDLLYQTSGISPDLIAIINPSKDGDALEKAVRNFTNYDLYCKPGTKYMYSTINYDVIGLIVEKVSGKKYENYMYGDVLKPLGLSNVLIGRENLIKNPNASLGYKCGFLVNDEYNASIYRGNTPAGYIITDAEDMADWLKVQLKTANMDDEWKAVIDKSHKADITVKPTRAEPYKQPFRYASGWLSFDDNKKLLVHGGSNPTFSSYIVIDPEEKLGVSVMANRNTSYSYYICLGIYALMHGDKPIEASSDFYAVTNEISIAVLIISLLAALYAVIRLVLLKKRLSNGVIKKRKNSKKKIYTLVIWLILVAAMGTFLYLIPTIFLWEYPWKFIAAWAPDNTIAALIVFYAAFCFVAVYRIIKTSYYKDKNISHKVIKEVIAK
jgi:CubicO group peptidase (beta-lactamase class C family)